MKLIVEFDDRRFSWTLPDDYGVTLLNAYVQTLGPATEEGE